jgi:hypothetical protein
MRGDFIANRAGLAALVMAAWAMAMASAAHSYPYEHLFHHDVDSPVLALEISRNAGDIDAVLRRSEPKKRAAAAESMVKVNKLDLIFIPLYAFSIWSLARVFSNRTRLLTISILAAALCDYLEDWQIYRCIGGMNPPVYISSLAKWALLGIVFIGLSGILLRSASEIYTLSTKRLLAIGYFVSGLLILIDVVFGDWTGYSHIELTMSIFSILVIINVVGLLGHYLAIPGIKQTFVENFCEERKKVGADSIAAVKAERR